MVAVIDKDVKQIRRQVFSTEIKEFFNRDNVFRDEKHMTDYIYDNIDLFFNDIICSNEKIIEARKEYPIKKYINQSGKRNIRFDLYIKTKENEYIIELKNPRTKGSTGVYSQLRNSIVQCMTYKMYKPDAKIFLVSTLWDDIVFELINYYGLDINFILFNKEYTAYMSRDNTN